MHILRHKIILFKQKTKAFKQILLSRIFIQLTQKTAFQSFPDLTSFFFKMSYCFHDQFDSGT
jgi:hypothetical protein